MRKFILVLALLVAGCATVPNPVTQSRMDVVNASWGGALALMVAYRDSCAQRLLPPSCRTVVFKMQAAAPPVQNAVIRARAFAANPQISSTDLIEVASNTVNDFKVLQMTLGVK